MNSIEQLIALTEYLEHTIDDIRHDDTINTVTTILHRLRKDLKEFNDEFKIQSQRHYDAYHNETDYMTPDDDLPF